MTGQESSIALPDLAELWAREIGTDGDQARQALAVELREAEEQVAAYRTYLQECSDAVTAELIARYREGPHLALDLLT